MNNITAQAASMYLDRQMSTPEVAKALGLSISTVRRAVLAAGGAMRSAKQAGVLYGPAVGDRLRGRQHITSEMREAINVGIRRAAGKAKGIGTTSKGYLRYTATTRPHYDRLVHVVVMEEHLGRRLLPGEVVHHIDQNKQNNELSNLQLMSSAAHTALHRRLEKEMK